MFAEAMMRQMGIPHAKKVLVIDKDLLWHRFGDEKALEAQGYALLTPKSALELRYLYEKQVRPGGEESIVLLAQADFYLPYDIMQNMQVCELSYESILPKLHAQTLRTKNNLDWDLLCEAYVDLMQALSAKETASFCENGMYSQRSMERLGAKYINLCRVQLQNAPNYQAWISIADKMGKLAYYRLRGAQCDYEGLYSEANAAFITWLQGDYRYLSATRGIGYPTLLSQTPDILRRKGGNVALILMDGMSFSDFHLILQALSDFEMPITYSGAFSFIPSITSVARQSLFSGKLPSEHEQPFSLQCEEAQWKEYWVSNGLHVDEVFFGKTEEPEVPNRTKVAGVVINFIDDLIHSQLQGEDGMLRDIEAWMRQGRLIRLIRKLHAEGFKIAITADHGNTAAVGQGRLIKPRLITESASRRAAIYRDFVEAKELDKFEVVEYAGIYMPKDYRYYSFMPKACYGDKGTTYITHGGMTIEEVVVPFAWIGET